MERNLYDLEAYDYHLPEELIAQEPVEPRDASRLMVINRKTGTIEHRIFREIVEYLIPGDTMVFNVSKVIPARLVGRKSTGAKVEVLLLEKLGEGVWKCLVKPGKAIKDGTVLIFGEAQDSLMAKCLGRAEEGTRILEFSAKSDSEIFSFGQVPLPHYIKNQSIDFQRYQTVYAKNEGSVAAPTAGLHFTPELIERIKKKGVNIAEITLHVGIGTFRPVKAKDIREHKMHEEFYVVPKETVQVINETKKSGGRIIAVGTTSVRTLETIARLPLADSYSGKTDIFIYPPFEFKLVDALVTNFHLPKSTLLMLVSAFAGYDLTMKFYNLAVAERYRFFSFGDACFII
ncbi:tRNA preQ1(34) S-adenosylmethionine ribosyltransferase-isomerase QueA [Fervidobacterium thailandense]|uniref:S-adenosylmethionine:tRNA ribosyltransferase-isomerase n=1 Tax=Fervidobacterium thailandense TaxID=1008305 RepID=A0A1E3G4K3_9BACT|nr:tRNA preQ1(34) S-adenosylmethionine ribosyltransferase-isomerase QueA [Fervidobacterium thailandense]ODN31187.1 tRNA preQ1(34) S-adenosylmethionine ribosyltransferase-isomerase QueA [Fervidobacterium thailandense]